MSALRLLSLYVGAGSVAWATIALPFALAMIALDVDPAIRNVLAGIAGFACGSLAGPILLATSDRASRWVYR